MKKTYQWIDVTKLLCALLVMYMHCYCYDLGKTGYWIKHAISTMGVPFFFITSGFLFSKGISSAKNRRAYLWKYWIRIIVMYVLWTLITLPVEIKLIQAAHPEYGVILTVAYSIRAFLFSGSLGIYWYLLALIWGIPILYYILFLLRDKRHKLCSYILIVALFFIGVLYNSGALNNTYIYIIIHTIWGGERNVWNVGLFYLCIGSLVATFEKKIVQNSYLWILLLFVSVILDMVIQTVWNVYICQAFSAFALFNLACFMKIKIPANISFQCRVLSTVVYLLHFPFILCFDYYLQRGTIIDCCLALCFSCITYFILKKVIPSRLTKGLFGN